MRWLLVSACFIFLGCYSCDNLPLLSKTPPKKVHLQPLDDGSRAYTSYILSEVKKIYPDVILHEPIAMPRHAWYSPKKRYRADSLIVWLKNRMKKGEVVVGITTKDISTTKKEVGDYGVMGLGFRPGKACVASTFRLNKRNLREQLFKVVIHELGHTQGLDHCPVKTCFMRDARGGNPLDEEKEFCGKCRSVLAGRGWNL